MTHRWNKGDLAVVEVAQISGDEIAISCTDGGHYWLPTARLHPLPADSPLAAANARVAEAAERWWMETSNEIGPDGKTGYSAMRDALADRRALLASPVPVDTVAELVRIAKEVAAASAFVSEYPKEQERLGELLAAIAAVEAARAKR